MEWYFIVLLCLGAIALILLAFAFFIYRIAFGARCDKNPLLKYFTAEELSLNSEPVQIKRGGVTLRGYIYTKDGVPAKNALVVFCHGLGAGHAAYMTEINTLCEGGFTVLALDNRGCDLSEGKNIKGMYSGVETAKAAVDFARSQPQFKDSKIHLVGHSWGGYSALCASCERKVDSVVALSAPVSPVKTVCFAAAQIITKPFAAVLCPFIAFVDFLHFGAKSNKNAAKCAGKSGVPILLIQGDKDNIVPLNKSAYAHANGTNIKKRLAAGKSHNPYNTPEAQAMMIELSAKLAAARKMSEEEREYFRTFDFYAATREDEEVMTTILDFLNA